MSEKNKKIVDVVPCNKSKELSPEIPLTKDLGNCLNLNKNLEFKCIVCPTIFHDEIALIKHTHEHDITNYENKIKELNDVHENQMRETIKEFAKNENAIILNHEKKIKQLTDEYDNKIIDKDNSILNNINQIQVLVGQMGNQLETIRQKNIVIGGKESQIVELTSKLSEYDEIIKQKDIIINECRNSNSFSPSFIKDEPRNSNSFAPSFTKDEPRNSNSFALSFPKDEPRNSNSFALSFPKDEPRNSNSFAPSFTKDEPSIANAEMIENLIGKINKNTIVNYLGHSIIAQFRKCDDIDNNYTKIVNNIIAKKNIRLTTINKIKAAKIIIKHLLDYIYPYAKQYFKKYNGVNTDLMVDDQTKLFKGITLLIDKLESNALWDDILKYVSPRLHEHVLDD